MSLGTLFPYLPVFYHSLSLSGIWIGLLGSITPTMTLLASPIWGWVVDRFTSSSSRLTLTKGMILTTTYLLSVSLRCLLPVLTNSGADSRPTQIVLVALVATTAIIFAPVKPLIDSMAMKVLDGVEETRAAAETDEVSSTDDPIQGESKPRVSSYGKIRLFGQLGFGLGSSLVGMGMRRFGATMEETTNRRRNDFLFAFLAHAVLAVPTVGVMGYVCRLAEMRKEKAVLEDKTEVGADDTDVNIKSLVVKLLKRPSSIMFFSLVFIVGLSSGIIENFAYVRLREVGGTGREMGISRIVSSAAGVPMFFFSGAVASKYSIDRLLVWSLGAYVARFLIYANMKAPLGISLIAEALRGVTFGAFWSASTIHAHRISPAGTETTVIALLNAAYGGLGQSVGSLVGGWGVARWGTRGCFLRSAGTLGGVIAAVSVYFTMCPPVTKEMEDKKLEEEVKRSEEDDENGD